MKPIMLVILVLFTGPLCLADADSGPNRHTIWNTAWGTIFYEPISMGSHKFEFNTNDIRITSDLGEVRILGNEANSFRITSGNDLLTIKTTTSGYEFQRQKQKWSLSLQNNGYTLVTNSPDDSIQFERNANSFSIKGSKGYVNVSGSFGDLSITSSTGNVSIKNYLGSRTITGVSLGEIPYFGRGVYISFHGVGILIDMVRLFPVPEVVEWLEWKPIVGAPFNPSSK